MTDCVGCPIIDYSAGTESPKTFCRCRDCPTSNCKRVVCLFGFVLRSVSLYGTCTESPKIFIGVEVARFRPVRGARTKPCLFVTLLNKFTIFTEVHRKMRTPSPDIYTYIDVKGLETTQFLSGVSVSRRHKGTTRTAAGGYYRECLIVVLLTVPGLPSWHSTVGKPLD